MPAMWELPQSSEPPRPFTGFSRAGARFAISITVTDYTVHVLRNMPLLNTSPAAKGKWIAIDRIPQIPHYRVDAENPEGWRHHLTL